MRAFVAAFLVACNRHFASEQRYPRKIRRISVIRGLCVTSKAIVRTHRPRMTLIRLICTDLVLI